MRILLDPEHHETHALFNLPVAWTGASVLEVGSGDGRLTWRFADKVARVVGLEPDKDKHAAALENRPRGFGHVEFLDLSLVDFYKYVTLSEAKSLKHLPKETLRSLRSLRVTQDEKFDLVVLSWSL